MKSIIFLSGAVPPQTGGELYNFKVSKYIASQGLEQEYVSLHKYKLFFKLNLLPFVGNFLISLFLLIVIKKSDSVLIVDHYYSKYTVLLQAFKKAFGSGKIITLVHLFDGYNSADSFGFRRYIFSFLEKTRLVFSDVIVATSEYSRREVISLGISPDIVYSLPPGLDQEDSNLLSESERNSEPRKILCVANFIPRKGQDYLIKAYASIKPSGYTLHLVGSPGKHRNYYIKIQRLIKSLKLEKQVFLHDGRNKQLVKELYLASSIFVLPSFKETFGIVLIEAMYYKLPIITTNVSAMPELVKHNENGLLVSPGNIQELARALKILTENPNIGKNMGSRGFEFVKTSYRWEETCSKFTKLVKSCLNESC
ncbi:glycosyltransferase family 4 protein [Nodosilinea sp. E11]|uniref:glycosyltransferase family 4 protein n=1 Tax=Nodosilinea sp. E11 TaxID=3037479 RepID=UPI00293515C6|nr:glycosyltransferase family 4 protein [Nodosilinea sp. E11]WOD37412.1 glycosyltransferase family 4 protein [Nodosilinea sp. E11]